jgi:enoyl-CoA hydratase
MPYVNIIVTTQGRVGIIQLNRPKALNALSQALFAELNLALDGFANDPGIAAIILTGNERAFAAGADISEMKDLSAADIRARDFLASWDHVTTIGKPIIAAVAGFALGGGCELALMCDIIIAADTAKFGLPEITIGIFPGVGGTQRLVRAIGKAKAMEMVLTGRMMEASEAEASGLVSRVVPAAELQSQALAIAEKIAGLSAPVVKMAKAAINQALETSLKDGLHHERQEFYSLFDFADQKEGMSAFLEKRPPQFKNR